MTLFTLIFSSQFRHIALGQPADVMAFLWAGGVAGWVVCYTIAYLLPTNNGLSHWRQYQGRVPIVGRLVINSRVDPIVDNICCAGSPTCSGPTQKFRSRTFGRQMKRRGKEKEKEYAKGTQAKRLAGDNTSRWQQLLLFPFALSHSITIVPSPACEFVRGEQYRVAARSRWWISGKQCWFLPLCQAS